MKRIILALLLIASIVNNSYSQPTCGSDILHDQKMRTDPVYRETMQKQFEQIRQYIEKNKSRLTAKTNSPQAPLYFIPVVVHVIHTGGPVGSIYNPTDAQILNTITYLNQVFDGTWPGTEGVGEIQIQFVVAQRDPNCNPTNGINRVNGSGVAEYVTGGIELQTTNGAPELSIKNLSRWSNADYYNVWVVNRIDGADGTSGTFVAGYAYFPGASALLDGTVMLATQMAPGSITLPHEIGHAFNLFHPFEGATGPNQSICPPAETDCATQHDRICDIDPITQPPGFLSRGGSINSCTGTLYSINSEHNIMNYTDSATLFTADQKTRLLASAGIAPRLSLSTSLGGTPTNVGGTQCPPKINFQFTDDQNIEFTTSTTDCRGYTDYTYNMVIGNNPSIAATATLNVSGGTATEGADFDVTTNGNFGSPSKVLTFPSGSNASQPFTIRIYDDASVESAETFTFAFTVNAGGGNAVAGDGRPNFTFTINDNDAAPVVPGTPADYKVGVNGGSVATQSVFRGEKQRHRVQVLFTAAALNAVGATAGNITALTLNVTSKNSTQPFQGFTISMANTAATNVGTGYVPGPLTQVYTSNYTTSVGNNTFTFGTGGGSSSSFAWDGTSNIIIQFCYDNGASPVDVAADGIEAQGNAVALTVYANYTTGPGVGCTLPAAFASTNRINATFTFALAGNPIVTSLTSKTAYLGPNSDVVFYTNTGETMARVVNLGAHDYGCTQVIVDRVGSSSVPFWNNNPANYLMSKTFRVVPTTNNASGNYQITLYYSQAEVTGWEAATGQSFTNIQLVKVGTQISDVTPGNPSGGGPVNIITPTTSTFGTGSTLTATLSNGFSGFGAGIAGFALPVKLIDFTGRLEKNSVVLNWKTTFEQNSKGFEIERSFDGTNYAAIGFVTSAGNSNTTRTYVFNDPDVAQPMNYYRLRQVDIDDHFEYSKVVTIKNANNAAKPFLVMNNPFHSSIDIQFSRTPTAAVRIRLMDVAGKTIQSWDKNNQGLSRMRLNTNGSLPSGTYLLEVRANGQVYIEKLIKQ